MTVQSIAVFMGAQFGNDPQYTVIAEKLGQLIAEKKLKLVYGGGRDGLMGATALSTMAHGGEVIGITPNNLAEDAISPEQVTRLIEVDSMSERKDLMMRYADAFVFVLLIWFPNYLCVLHFTAIVLSNRCSVSQQFLPVCIS